MFTVLFEVRPKPDQWDAYLGYAKLLKPELEQMEGFPEAFPLLHREQRMLLRRISAGATCVLRDELEGRGF